ncbi:MAG TPA: TolC family protein [Tepidisphaeraceae bacterium]|nr:TolC family protein [Tepidisphaeraceae bacterium]
MVVAAALAAGGCVDQHKEIAKYRKVLDGPAPLAVDRDYSKGKQLSLEQALLLASGYNEQLDIQGENYLQGLIARDRAYAAFAPTISLAPQFTWENRPINRGSTLVVGGTGAGSGSGTGTVVTGGRNKYTITDVPVAARANLFNGFRDVSTINAAWADIKRRRGLLLDLQETVLLETAQVYYQVLLAERSAEVLKNSVTYQDARVQDMTGRLRAGIAQPLDLAQTQAQDAATRAQLVTAQNNVRTGRITLAYLTNGNVQDATLVDRLELPQQLPSPAEATDIAQKTRPDIAAAAAQVEAARQNVQVAIGEYYPSINLDLSYYLHRETFPTNLEWLGILTANVPIFTAGIIEADVRLAWSQLRQSLLAEWQLIRQVNQDVRIDWQNLNASRDRIVELTTEVTASQEALRQATQRYSVGLATNLDVLTAQDQLLSSQLDLATEEFNHKIYYLDLLRGMGRLVRPETLNALSAGPTSRPTTEQTKPVVPRYEIPPMSVPGLRRPPGPAPTTFPTQPFTMPSTEPSYMPPATQP